MAIKVGINGFGRIGRLLTRILVQGHPHLELAAINVRANSFQLAHLFKYDSVHGRWDGDLEYTEELLTINQQAIAVLRRPEPAGIPWSEFGVEIVLECTGKFKDADSCQGHLDNGAQKVIVGAPGKGADATICMGVNQDAYDPAQHHIISNASCTTNCLAPVAKVLNDSFGIEHGLMTTIHAYTMTQRLLDGSHSDIRRARAAAVSMVPTSTGAARLCGEVIPELSGKVDGMAVRVPTADASLVDLTCRLSQEGTVNEINDAFRRAAAGPMQGVLAVSDEPLVSVDYVGCPYSSVVDAELTQVINGRLAKVLSWYDNEAGFAHRVVDLAAFVSQKF